MGHRRTATTKSSLSRKTFPLTPSAEKGLRSGKATFPAQTRELDDEGGQLVSKTRNTTPTRTRSRPSTAIKSLFTKTSLRFESFLAPGPATDHIVQVRTLPKGISKEQLIALAQERNVRNGRDANEGLELFLPQQAPIQKHLNNTPEHRKGEGFRVLPIHHPMEKAKSLTTLLDQAVASFDKPDTTTNRRQTMMVQTFPSRQSSPEQITQAQFENYKRCTTAQIPNTIDKLNKRLIMSREANHVRATTMAMTKIYAKERKRKLYKVPKDTWTLEPSQTFQDTMKGAKIGLRSSLETKLVDKLAAAEIETTKHVDLDSYPKLSNEQIEGKLTRLRIHAESGFKPLEFARSMELIHLSNKRIR